MSLMEIMKKASLGAVEAENPVSVRFGTVTSAAPLQVRVDQRLALTSRFLVVPETLTEYRISVDGEDVLIRRGLETGDRVVLLRMQGGQKYLILDRVVSS